MAPALAYDPQNAAFNRNGMDFWAVHNSAALKILQTVHGPLLKHRIGRACFQKD